MTLPQIKCDQDLRPFLRGFAPLRNCEGVEACFPPLGIREEGTIG
jgi:hypothetical protein